MPNLAAEIIRKIKDNEPIDYSNVVIENDLNISELDLPVESVEWTCFGMQRSTSPTIKKVVTSSIRITDSEIKGELIFSDIILKSSVCFKGTRFSGNSIDFRGAQFANGDADFERAQFKGGNVDFRNTRFTGGCACFQDAHFERGDADFEGAKFIGGDADFNGAQFTGGDVYFENAQFEGGDADFSNAVFMGDSVYFKGAYFIGGNAEFKNIKFNANNVTFRDSKFSDPWSQEQICMKTKKHLENIGNKEEADYHFYCEMVGKRKRKQFLIRFIEKFFIQWIFGYGVHPFRLAIVLFFTVFSFGFIYFVGKGISGAELLIDNLKFSFATAVAPGYLFFTLNPGYTGYHPLAAYQLLAIVEAIFGTFLWASFIGTFARKYMR